MRIIDRKALEKAYLTEGLTQEQCSKRFKASRLTIRNSLAKYGIAERRLRPCEECGLEFMPKRLNQKCCSNICLARRRLDIKYFGGLRHTAIGFNEKICWICGKTTEKPQVHHVIGKENAAEPLVVLCYGCHNLVSKLGQRNFLDDPEMVEDLLTLARYIKGLPNARTVVKFEEVE